MTGLPVNEYKELQSVLGSSLHVRGFALSGPGGDVIRNHLAQLDRFSLTLLRRLRLNGLNSIEIGPGSVADFSGYEHLANIQPPGHHDGVTFSDIAGLYDSGLKRVILGNQGLSVEGLVPHELGHAMGDLLGIYQNKELRAGYLNNANTGRLAAFFLDQGEPSERGLREFFADLVMNAILTGRATRYYGPEIERLVAGQLLRD